MFALSVCPHCGGRMVAGFVVDRSYGNCFQEEWIEGQPRRRFCFSVVPRGAIRRKVTTYRCVVCGFLESYARAASCAKCGCELGPEVWTACPACGADAAGESVSPRRVAVGEAMRQAGLLGQLWRLAAAARLLLAWIPGSLF
jgi:hypothetical protein